MSDIRKSIVWADWSWNPVWGCLNKCPYCYARNIAKRFGKQICGRDDFAPVWIEKNFQKKIPKYATHIFVNSMSDIAFWEQDWIDSVYLFVKAYSNKKFLFLSKKSMFGNFPKNAYFGKTINCQKDYLFSIHIGYDFYSIEPIFERIDLNANPLNKNLKQIIVGAETGNRKGKVIPQKEWIEEIRIFCQSNGIKLFEKDSLKEIVKRPLIQERI